jgi:hypothetical protein
MQLPTVAHRLDLAAVVVQEPNAQRLRQAPPQRRLGFRNPRLIDWVAACTGTSEPV